MSKKMKKHMKKYKKLTKKMHKDSPFLSEILNINDELINGDMNAIKKCTAKRNKTRKKGFEYFQLCTERRVLRDKICKKMKNRGWLFKLYDAIDTFVPVLSLIVSGILSVVTRIKKFNYTGYSSFLSKLLEGAKSVSLVKG